MKLNLLVIRTDNQEELKKQYEILGLKFEYERHGKGPFHYASESDGFVFEIYPLTKSMHEADSSIRLGFQLNNLDSIIKKIENSNWEIISKAKATESERIIVIQDLDGRKVELNQK